MFKEEFQPKGRFCFILTNRLPLVWWWALRSHQLRTTDLKHIELNCLVNQIFLFCLFIMFTLLWLLCCRCWQLATHSELFLLLDCIACKTSKHKFHLNRYKKISHQEKAMKIIHWTSSLFGSQEHHIILNAIIYICTKEEGCSDQTFLLSSLRQGYRYGVWKKKPSYIAKKDQLKFVCSTHWPAQLKR